ncbi:LytR/AlgR family response regulator transcription factor [Flavihumibacter cheonanensis]|uniref:LytR/AlgR family response regulator transcription factor n=1 Tax=Flavihumibacter cheonanensis TaxID=1442385 RepID=UPI001EF97494|nr:LytTR family DNA-binding domain-containing protein [Flavihumibacter cheonanensis]MCG7754625.1 LytTR family DNA-binding domain-containing protein [Flavihumibacter cheonanensis]
MKYTAVIVEDLSVAADVLQKYCIKSGKVNVVGSFKSTEEAIPYLTENSVDLIFLDIEMPGANGFSLLDQMQYQPQVILTTSKTEYAFDAFEYSVTDFLRKPFSYQRFVQALEKLKPLNEKKEDTEEMSHVFIKSDGKLIRLNNDDILYIESMGDYVKFITNDKKIISHNTIKALTEKINPDVFCKVHRSYIINMNKISDIRDNTLYIANAKIPVSKANRSTVMSRIKIV